MRNFHEPPSKKIPKPSKREKAMQKISALTNVGNFFNTAGLAFEKASKITTDKKLRKRFERSSWEAYELAGTQFVSAALEGCSIIEEDFEEKKEVDENQSPKIEAVKDDG